MKVNELYMTVQYAAQNRNNGAVYYYEFRQFVSLARSHDEAIGIALRNAKENHPPADGWHSQETLAWGLNNAISMFMQKSNGDHDKVSILKSIIETCEAEMERLERIKAANGKAQ